MSYFDSQSLGQVRCAVIDQIEVAAVFHRKLREGLKPMSVAQR